MVTCRPRAKSLVTCSLMFEASSGSPQQFPLCRWAFALLFAHLNRRSHYGLMVRDSVTVSIRNLECQRYFLQLHPQRGGAEQLTLVPGKHLCLQKSVHTSSKRVGLPLALTMSKLETQGS